MNHTKTKENIKTKENTKAKENIKVKEIFKIIAIILACFVLEFVLSNQLFLLTLIGCDETTINLSEASFPEDNTSIRISNGEAVLEKGVLQFDEINQEVKTICIETKNGNYRYIDVKIGFTDDNFAYENGFDNNSTTHKIYLDQAKSTNCIRVRPYGKIQNLRIEFKDGNEGEFIVSSIKLNAAPPISFNFIRFSFLLVFCVLVKMKAWRWKFKKSDTPFLVFLAVMLCVLLGIVTLMQSGISGEPLLEPYPLENQYTRDQYQQLFSAFHEGKLDITVETDPNELAALECPYDITERDTAEISGDYWDRAYFNGKFYSYFGIAPVFTVYMPVYILTGKLPSEILASSIVTCYAVLFISLLYVMIIKRFCSDAPFIPVILGELAIIFGSSIFMQCMERIFYYIASVSGIGSLAAFLFFLLSAYYESNYIKRLIMLGLSGVSVVLIASSRPTMLIYCASALVPAFYIFKDKKESIKRKAVYVCSIGIPIIIGAIGLMTYNYLRFKNPLEFGFTYQMTVSNASANGFSLSFIPAAIYHYFLQLPRIKGNFPFVEMNNGTFLPYPRYTYTNWSIGAFSYPAVWGVLALPLLDKKKDIFRKRFLQSLTACAVILAFIDMCKAGAHYRYVADILLPLLIVGIVVLLNVLTKSKKLGHRLYAMAYLFVVFALVLTVVLGHLLIFANENAFFMGVWAPITQMLRFL